jgi:hypothetical protein
MLRELTRAVVSERSPCGPASADCRALLALAVRGARVLFLVPNGKGSADALSGLWGRSKAAARDRKEALEGATSGVFSSQAQCAPGAGGPSALPDGSTVELRLLAACGSSESTSGLVQALAAGETGGIDFTSLELSYLSDVPARNGSRAISYAFGAARGGGGGGGTVQGLRNAKQASDAFFVWLALPASDFWVNLNPNEPYRIIEEEFGRTDAGRVLLDADLQLKKSVPR